MILACPDDLPKELDNLIYQLAEAWRDSDIRPRVAANVLKEWDHLIEQWVSSDDLPLLVRKPGPKEGRVSVVQHRSGRELVPSDNTPGNWSLALALNGECPSLADIRALVESRAIPVAMILQREERVGARFTGTRARFSDLNKLGWKVCHRRPIGIGRGTFSRAST